MSQQRVNYYYQELREASLGSLEESVVYKNTSFIQREDRSKELGWNDSLLNSHPETTSISRSREDVAKGVMAVTPVRRGAITPPISMPAECKSTASSEKSKGLCEEKEIVVDDSLLGQAINFHALLEQGATEECLKQRFGAKFAVLMEYLRKNRSTEWIPLSGSTQLPEKEHTVEDDGKCTPEVITLEDSDSDGIEIVKCVQGSSKPKTLLMPNLKTHLPTKININEMLKREARFITDPKAIPTNILLEVARIPLPRFEFTKVHREPAKELSRTALPQEDQLKVPEVEEFAKAPYDSEDLYDIAVTQTRSSDSGEKKSKKVKKTKRKRRKQKSRGREDKQLEVSVDREWFENIYQSKWNRNKAQHAYSLSGALAEFRSSARHAKEDDCDWTMDAFIEFLTDLNLGAGFEPSTSTNRPAFTGAIMFDRQSTIPWSSRATRSYPVPHPYEEWTSRMRMRTARYLETEIDFLGLAGRSCRQWTTEVDLCAGKPVNISVKLGDIEYSLSSFLTTCICVSVTAAALADTDKWAESVCLQVYCNEQTTELNATLHSGRPTASMPATNGLPLTLMGGRVRLTLTVASIQFSLPSPLDPAECQIPVMSDPLQILHFHSSFLYFTCQTLEDFTRMYGRDVRLLGSVLKLTRKTINEHNVIAILSFADALRFETLHFACEQFLINSNTSAKMKKILADGYMLPNLELSLKRLNDSFSPESPQSIEKVPPLRIYREENDAKIWRVRQVDKEC